MDANLGKWIALNYLPGMKWDGNRNPEGLLGTLPAIGSCLLGVFAGLLLRERSVQPGAEATLSYRRSMLIGRASLGSAIPDYQADLDILVRARRRYSADSAWRVLSDHQRLGMAQVVNRARVDSHQCDRALDAWQRHELLRDGCDSLRRE
jgi:hypothetical protein